MPVRWISRGHDMECHQGLLRCQIFVGGFRWWQLEATNVVVEDLGLVSSGCELRT
jgi:hypothetical protein